jgi:hypothetical protein
MASPIPRPAPVTRATCCLVMAESVQSGEPRFQIRAPAVSWRPLDSVDRPSPDA